jgi:hypothetical protein
MKIRPVRAELFHADGRTDMTKPVVAFRCFANPAKNEVSFFNVCPVVCLRMEQLDSHLAFLMELAFVLKNFLHIHF